MLDDYEQVVAECKVFVAEYEKQVVGVLVLRRAAEGFLLENIAVHPMYQGEGIGSQLLKLAESEAKVEGFESIYLYTNEKMTENRALYERIGYKTYAHRVEKGLSRIYMRKTL